MNAFQDAFDALLEMIRNAQTVYTSVEVGALPPEDSMAVAISTGDDVNTDLALHGDLDLDLVLNAKNKYQRSVIAALTDVHYTLPRMVDLPRGDGWQILAVETSTYPAFIEHDGDQFLYGSGLRVLLYLE